MSSHLIYNKNKHSMLPTNVTATAIIVLKEKKIQVWTILHC